MDLLQQIVARAKAEKQRIVLPEAEEERTLKAADRVLADGIAELILIGNPAHIKEQSKERGICRETGRTSQEKRYDIRPSSRAGY